MAILLFRMRDGKYAPKDNASFPPAGNGWYCDLWVSKKYTLPRLRKLVSEWVKADDPAEYRLLHEDGTIELFPPPCAFTSP